MMAKAREAGREIHNKYNYWIYRGWRLAAGSYNQEAEGCVKPTPRRNTVSLSVISSSVSALDQWQLLQQMQTNLAAGSTSAANTATAASNPAAIQYIQPAPPPPPRPGPPPARLPNTDVTASPTDETDAGSGSTASSASQQLSDVQSQSSVLLAGSGETTNPASGTSASSGSAGDMLTRQLTDVRSHLLTLQGVASLPEIAPQPIIPPTGAFQPRTLLTA